MSLFLMTNPTLSVSAADICLQGCGSSYDGERATQQHVAASDDKPFTVCLCCRDLAVPKRVEGLQGVNVVLLSGGWRHAVAADDQGRMFGWGWNKVSHSSSVNLQTTTFIISQPSNNIRLQQLM